MRAANRSAWLGLMVLVMLAACSRAIRQPEVRLEGVRVGGLGLRGGTLYAQVYISNPNGFTVETRELNYDLQLADPSGDGDWISFSNGTLRDPVRIGGGQSTIIEVPVQFRYDDFGGALRSLIETGTFNYRVRGDVRLTEPIGRTIPFTRTGVFSMGGGVR